MTSSNSGRYAPSPTGRLHLGNLRTALVAWLFARSTGDRFVLRFEDLDTDAVRSEHYGSQLADLAALGLDWDDEPLRQSEHLERYRAALEELVALDLVYPCFCSRKDIREASQAPNGPWSHAQYPGTCRHLSSAQRAERSAAGREPALRVRGDERPLSFDDVLCGPVEGVIDDFVVRRNDGTPAYNLVVVLDDDRQDVDLVVRADDLLSSTPRQLFIAELLEITPPRHAHVPLVLNERGDRLAKRDGSVTLADRVEAGVTPQQVLSQLGSSLGLCRPEEAITVEDLLERFDPTDLPTEPWTLTGEALDDPALGLD